MFNTLNKAEVEFEILEEIGNEGQNSRVYKVLDKQLNAILAIKEIDIKHFSDPEEFFHESRRLYISSHKNVIDVKYACKDTNNIFIAMPYFKRGSLKKLIDKKYLTISEIIKISLDIISGLHNIHSKKLIHFDIKPDNILLSDCNEALISDFGLAKPTNLSGIAGQDRQYIKHRPPESFDYDHFDLTYDIYQFGLTLYRMCNGNDIFYEQFNKYIDNGSLNRVKYKNDCKRGRFPDRSLYLLHIPNRLRVIIKKCLAEQPDNRYSSAIEIANELSEIEGNILNWQYEKSNNVISFTKRTDDKIINLRIDENNSALSTKVYNNGRSQRITAFCKENIVDSEIKEFLEMY